MTLYPWGYAKRLVTLEELKRLARFDLMDPEYAARLEAWLVSQGGFMGIGGAFREVQPVKPGFAPTGMTFHMLQLMANAQRKFMAVDLVCRNPGSVHRSPQWEEVPRQGSGHSDISKYGVHCNVNGEPWHMQAIEIDGFQTWDRNGRPVPKRGFIKPILDDLFKPPSVVAPPVTKPVPPVVVPSVTTPTPDTPTISQLEEDMSACVYRDNAEGGKDIWVYNHFERFLVEYPGNEGETKEVRDFYLFAYLRDLSAQGVKFNGEKDGIPQPFELGPWQHKRFDTTPILAF